MKLSVVRFACALATMWSLVVFGTGVVNLWSPGYGEALLKIMESIYPGYHYGQWGIGGVVVAALYAALDAWIVGALLAWFYNLYAKVWKPKE
jgi:hypothetical protein